MNLNKQKIIFIAKGMRPRQIPKNILVFTAPLFSFSIDYQVWLNATYAFFAFCLISGSTYLINDSCDLFHNKP